MSNAFDQSQKVIGANLLTPAEFAAKKMVGRSTVSRHIAAGKINPTYVGEHKHAFIDGKKYAKYQFDDSKINNRFKD